VPTARADHLFRLRLGAITVAAVAIRVVWVLTFGRHQEVAGDQVFYHYQALALAKGDGFVNPYAWNDAAHRVLIPSALHPPGYSSYLAVASLLGLRSQLQHRLVSVLLGAAMVVVVGYVARRLAGDRAGLAAAGFAAVYPTLWVNDGVLAAESLYALAIALIFLTAYRLWEQPDLGRAAWLGAAIALAGLTRAEGVLLYVVLVVPLALVLRGPTLAKKAGIVAVAGATGALLLAPWVVRNMTTWDQPVVMSTGTGFVLEIANCDATYSGRYLGYWSEQCDRSWTWPVQPKLHAGMTASERAAARRAASIANARIEPKVEERKRQAAIDYISSHERRFPVVVAARVGRIWDLYRPAQSVEFNDFFERRGRWPSIAGLAMYYLLVVLAVVALVHLHRRKITIVPFIAVALTVTATAATSFGITRYRVGADVGLAILGGIAVNALWERWRPSAVTTT
jgi:hypothetical protein